MGVSDDSRVLHWHNEMEICYIKQGNGKYLINGIEYPFEAGDVFIINNDEIHVASDDSNLIMQVTMFDSSLLWHGGMEVLDYEYLMPFVETGKREGNKLDRKNRHIQEVIETLLEMQKEYELKPKKYDLMIKSMLLKLMTIIIRYFDGTMEWDNIEKTMRAYTQKLKTVIEYMETNHNRPIVLSELAGEAGLSVSHFCYMFRKYTGVPPIEYITQRRVCTAKEFLKCSDRKILDIALDSGFNSLSNFYKCFKKHTGLSPKQYRNE